MPINCPDNGKPRYRVKDTKKGKIRLAFCGNRVVETKSLKTGEVHKKTLRQKAKGK